MRKLILLIFSIITLNATETVNYYGDIVNMKLSQDSWNRLIFDSEINAEPIFSKEKNVDIYRANNSVFIKFKPMVKVEVLDKQEQILDIDYTNAKKSELFISTINGTYSFTIEPIKTVAKTYIIQNIQNKNENLLKFETNEPRKIFKDITKGIFLNEEVDNYEKLKLKTEATIINNITVNPLYVFKGKIYSAYLFNVVARENIDNLNEKIFLNYDLKNKRAISIKDKKLFKNQSTQLIIIVGN
ncbi:type-F conjugative transfer system secretin TraK [Arcobacter lanthieri]|uniref:TraK domain-containing protein n=1 Tax=Aliarcobacter lanthieri TaxID=1355374 RepID=UPI001923CC02|nr:type-F conjugative transfer system secretin TraK [Aliarcobacter lanthieri]MBL3518860.1 type-F conjugative transfer system secretin TraK [Aliarcobacter lanthieri]